MGRTPATTGEGDEFDSMQLWGKLYLVIWAVFVEFLLGTWPAPPAYVPYLHLALGLLIILILYVTAEQLRQTRVPARVKRIARASFALSVLMGFLGLLLWFNVGSRWTLPWVGYSVYQAILVIHIANALAIITQLAAVAIAYDMWEDHEFEKETEPGKVPPPSPAN